MACDNQRSCSVSGILDDIRKALNECRENNPDCDCGERWSDLDILNAINYAIDFLAGIRKDLFTTVYEVTFGPGCWHNLCELEGCCDDFISLNYSLDEPCYIPKEFCEGDGGVNPVNLNKCLEFSSDALADNTIIGYSWNPKNPCLIFIKREDDESTTIASVTCFTAPSHSTLDGDLPGRACQYKSFIFNFAMFHLLARDHNDTPGYIELVRTYWNYAQTYLGEVANADALLREKDKFLGRDYTDEDC